MSAVTCTLCLRAFETKGDQLPLILKECGHTFCKKCLINLLASKSSIICPNCSKKTDAGKGGVNSFPKAFGLLEVMQSKYQATQKCPMCPAVCKDSNSLRKHLEKVHFDDDNFQKAGKKSLTKYQCPNCGVKCKNMLRLEKHLEKVHFTMGKIQNCEEKKAAILSDIAMQCYLEGNYIESIHKLTQSIELNPSNYQYFTSRSLVYYKIYDYLNAYADSKHSIRLKPTAKANLIFAMSSYHLSKYAEARKGFDEALAFNDCSVSKKAKIGKRELEKKMDDNNSSGSGRKINREDYDIIEIMIARKKTVKQIAKAIDVEENSIHAYIKSTEIKQENNCKLQPQYNIQFNIEHTSPKTPPRNRPPKKQCYAKKQQQARYLQQDSAKRVLFPQEDSKQQVQYVQQNLQQQTQYPHQDSKYHVQYVQQPVLQQVQYLQQGSKHQIQYVQQNPREQIQYLQQDSQQVQYHQQNLHQVQYSQLNPQPQDQYHHQDSQQIQYFQKNSQQQIHYFLQDSQSQSLPQDFQQPVQYLQQIQVMQQKFPQQVQYHQLEPQQQQIQYLQLEPQQQQVQYLHQHPENNISYNFQHDIQCP